ncbi:hypothetical protein AB6N16_08515 [Pseudomonas marginalis]
MNTVLIHETGIHPWEQLDTSTDEKFITMTFLNQEYAGAWKTWCEVSLSIQKKWPKIVKWHTKLLPHHSKSQEYISQKKFYAHSKPEDIYRKNESTNIYSQIINLNSDAYNTDPKSMTGHHASMVLMLKKHTNLDDLWSKLSNLTDISKTENLKLILSGESSIYLRFHDSETHGVTQLIFHSKHFPLLEKIIKKINLEEIQQEDVYEFIHK